jgi:enamine deaminase RidA (YjgF/YER057c/UK114 family)
MARQHVSPEGHWTLKVEVPYSMGVRQGEIIMLAGQVDMEGDGIVRNPGDLDTQTGVSIGHIGKILSEMGAGMDALVKLVVFYKTDGGVDEDAYRARIGALLGGGARPAIAFVPLPVLAYPGMMVEIDAYAMLGEGGEALARATSTPAGIAPIGEPFAAAVRCGEMIFIGGMVARDAAGTLLHPGDVAAQSKAALDDMTTVLAGFGATMDDLVKLNAYYVAGGTAAEWEVGARVRASYFEEPGPVATGIPVHTLYPEGAMIRFDAWAMLGEDGTRIPRTYVWPEGHWDWTIHLPYKHGLKCRNMIFIGGQVSMDQDARILEVGDMAGQTRRSMDNIGKVLDGFGASFGDIMKVNAFYAGTDEPDDLHANVNVRSSYFSKPGPASTGVPLNHLAYEDMLIEIDTISMVD